MVSPQARRQAGFRASGSIEHSILLRTAATVIEQERAVMDVSDIAVLCLIPAAVWWFLASIAVATAAQKRGRSGSAWLGLSVGLGPLFAIILLLAYPVETAQENRERGDLSILSQS
jgi:hypothetical protein